MARAGDRLTNPRTGQTLVFRRTSAETAGELVEVEAIYEAGSERPPEHLHPRQEERFEVLEGEMRARVAGEERTLARGDTLTIPPGTPHAMWNEGAAPARLSWQTRPALRTEEFFESFFGLAQDGRVTAAGVPPPLHAAVLLREYRDEFRLTRPPAPVQALVLGALAALGRRRGLERHYRPRSTSS
jgi:quercetin dioxygenase-like cupin family protein